MIGRHADREDVGPWRVVGVPRDDHPDHARPDDRGRDPRAVGEGRRQQGMAVGGRRRRDDPRSERQPGPGIGVDRCEHRRGAADRPGTVTRHRDGVRERIPPAARPSLAEQPRHQRPTHDLRHSRRTVLGGRLRGSERDPGVRGIVERLGERRLPVPCRLGRPALPPVGRRRRRDLPVRAGQPRQRPRPRHHPVRVVAAATRRQPSTTRVPMGQPVDESRRGTVGRRRDVQVRQRVPGVRVGAVLRHDEIRPERRGQLGEQRLQQPRPMPPPRSPAAAARSPTSLRRRPRRSPTPPRCPGTGRGRSRGSRTSARPGRPSGSPARRRRDARRGRCTSPAGHRAAPAPRPGPGRRRCRSPTPGRASRDAVRRRGGGHAPRRRAGSPRPPGASHRPRPLRRRACRRRQGCQTSRYPPPETRTGRTRTAGRRRRTRVDATAAGRHPMPARARGPATPRPIAAGRSPARTGAA